MAWASVHECPSKHRQFSDRSLIRCRCAACPEGLFSPARRPSVGAVADPDHEKAEEQAEAGSRTHPGGWKTAGPSIRHSDDQPTGAAMRSARAGDGEANGEESDHSGGCP